MRYEESLHKRENGGWSASKGIQIDTKRNFLIETSINKISGINNNRIGLLFGRGDNENQFEFYYDGNGSFGIEKEVNGISTEYYDWTESVFINKGNGATNKLVVEKNDQKLYFYINNFYIADIPFDEFMGDYIGFSLSKNQKIEVDYLYIKYMDRNEEVTCSNNIFIEDFDSNINDWDLYEDEDISTAIVNGAFSFEHKRENGGWCEYNNIQINSERNFLIESTIKKISGINDNAIGIILGRKDNDNELEFYYDGNGAFGIERYENGTTTYSTGWTESIFINKGNGAINKLSVQKNKQNMYFYINDHYVADIPFTKFQGDKIGFTLSEKQKIEVDNLYITYLDENEFLVESELIFNDHFNNNRYEWWLINSKEANFCIDKDKYHLEYNNKDFLYDTTQEIQIDSLKNFSIETSICQISCDKENEVGFTWGQNDKNHILFSFLENDFGIVKSSDNEYDYLFFESEVPCMKTLNESNKLLLEKIGNLVDVYINDYYITSIAFENFLGSRFGYFVSGINTLEVDYLHIKYLDTKPQNLEFEENFYQNEEYIK